ncbi:hypothetical protein P3T27_003736 [Kitasatospora sp. MAA19]|uniref:hypothetical protein n=1 Tax=Kitasatospora sp. MAA19 TaxID=3035090 RepID=UPI0024731C9A|nr:hypothetical protein [Kitasatospora sp. MAA19]MDH6707007.1 hypothetical protein [Kitasatospora sp. MAA19]
MTTRPACPAPDCGAPVDLLDDANAAGRTWNCPICARWGVAWSQAYLANQPFEEPLVVLGRRPCRRTMGEP